MKRYFFVYILTNQNNKVLYIGVTNDLIRRISEHKNCMNINSFTSKYKLNKLVYYETFESPSSAIIREKQLKNWHRGWKLNLVKNVNPRLEDLFGTIIN